MKPEIIYIPVNYRSCRLNLIVVSVLFAAVLAWSLWVPWVNGFMFYLFGVWVCLALDFWTVWAKRDEDSEAAQAKLRDVCRNEVFQVERRKGTQKLEDAPAVIPETPTALVRDGLGRREGSRPPTKEEFEEFCNWMKKQG